MRCCTTCKGPFAPGDPPYLLRPTGKVYHLACVAEALNTWVEYEALPGWRRGLVRFLAWARRR